MTARRVAPSRDIRSVDFVRIDWNTVLKYTDNIIKSSSDKGWDDKMKALELVFKIRKCYENDDMNGYLNLLDNYRKEILI